jgi:NhaP-type Na+/H+ or K+/H+ antiporter
MNFSWLWIKHPRSGQADTMLTLAVLATLTAIGKFLLNGMVLTFMPGRSISFGTVDALLIGALLTPTLTAYVTRKMKDSPDAGDDQKSP